MLPTEAFADVVAFARLYNLKSLMVTSALCSAIATKTSSSIRWGDFSDFHFCIYNERVIIERKVECQYHRWQPVAALTFTSTKDTTEFVVAAFPYCAFEHLTFFQIGARVDAVAQVADSVVVKGALFLPDSVGGTSFGSCH